MFTFIFALSYDLVIDPNIHVKVLGKDGFVSLATIDVPPCHTDLLHSTDTPLLWHTSSEFNDPFFDWTEAKTEPELELISTPISFNNKKYLRIYDISSTTYMILKEKFNSSTLASFYGSLNETQFSNLQKRHAEFIYHLVLLGSAYFYKLWLTPTNHVIHRGWRICPLCGTLQHYKWCQTLMVLQRFEHKHCSQPYVTSVDTTPEMSQINKFKNQLFPFSSWIWKHILERV